MTLKTFLIRHQIKLSPPVLSLCQKSLHLMSISRDPLHDLPHIHGLLGNLDLFMSQSYEINWSRVNFEVLLLAICWHDTWKSLHEASNGRRLVFDQLAEGIGAMRLFGKYAKLYNLNPNIAKKVKYAIRKHSMLQFLPTRSLETKILKDMDKLEEWSSSRLRRGLGTLLDWQHLSPRLLSLGKFYIRHWMIPRSHKSYFEWTKTQLNKRKDPFIRETVLSIQRIAARNIIPLPHLSSPTEKQTTYPESAE